MQRASRLKQLTHIVGSQDDKRRGGASQQEEERFSRRRGSGTATAGAVAFCLQRPDAAMEDLLGVCIFSSRGKFPGSGYVHKSANSCLLCFRIPKPPLTRWIQARTIPSRAFLEPSNPLHEACCPVSIRQIGRQDQRQDPHQQPAAGAPEAEDAGGEEGKLREERERESWKTLLLVVPSFATHRKEEQTLQSSWTI